MIAEGGHRRPGGLRRITLSLLLACALLLGAVAPVAADFSASAVAEAANHMLALGIIKGEGTRADGTVDLALQSPITRAQLATLIVRAFGQQGDAQLLAGAATFRDTATHWASGYIAMAQRLAASQGATLGRTPTTFEPDATVTAAEALAFGMKVLGISPRAGLSWPMNYLQVARDAGIISEQDLTAIVAAPGQVANRGTVFVILDSLFRTYGGDGKTVYPQFRPATITVGSYPAQTQAGAVTLTGTVSGAKALTVAGTPVTFDAGGNFSATMPLNLGPNTIELVAVDQSGWPAKKTVTITRNPGPAAQLTVYLGTPEVPAGQSTPLTVIVKDKDGNTMPGAVYTVEAGALGSFEMANGAFTAGTKAAAGQITVTSGAASATLPVAVVPGPVAAVEPATATVPGGTTVPLVARDQYGNQLLKGVTWTVGAGAAVTPDGVFSATRDGAYTVMAAAGDKTAAAKVTVDSIKPSLAWISGQAQLVGTTVQLTPQVWAHSLGRLTFKAEGLPPGLKLDPATGIITGTLPMRPGNTLVTLTVTDAAGNSTSQSFSWTWYRDVNPPACGGDCGAF